MTAAFRYEDGTAAVGIPYTLEVVDPHSGEANEEIASGEAAAGGGIQVQLPGNGALVDAASRNGGIANLRLIGRWATQGGVARGEASFHANLGNVHSPPGVYTSFGGFGESEVSPTRMLSTVDVAEIECSQIWSGPEENDCYDPSISDEYNCRLKNWGEGWDGNVLGYFHHHLHGTEPGYLMRVNVGYRMKLDISVGELRRVDNSIGLALKLGNGSWQPQDARVEVHSTNASEDVNGTTFSPLAGQFDGSRAEVRRLVTYWEMYHTGRWEWHENEGYTGPPGKCIYAQRQEPGPMNTQGRQQPIYFDVPWLHSSNDCVDDCAAPPECRTCPPSWYAVNASIGQTKQRGTAVSEHGGFCLFICVSNVATHHEYQRVEYRSHSGCASGWYLYWKAGETAESTPAFWVDSGLPGDGHTNWVPDGC